MQVGIIGGGIGGLCLAQGLVKAGIDVTVYERDATPTSRLQGYRLSIDGRGSAGLYACLPTPLWELLVATAGDNSRGTGFLDERLRPLTVADGDAPEYGEHAVSRVALRRLLLAGLDDVVRFGKQFTRLEGGTAYFADGSSATPDVLVAADGANSRMWAQLHPEAERLELPAVAIGGKLYLTDETLAWLPDELLTGNNTFWPRHAGFFFTAAFRRRPNAAAVAERLRPDLEELGLDTAQLLHEPTDRDYLLWGYTGHRDALPANFGSVGPDVARAELGRQSADWHPALHRLIMSSEISDVFQLGFSAAQSLELGPATTITALGDAVHHMPPVGGLGGNTALRDAQHLCAALIAVHQGQAELSAALTEYETDMLAHGFATVHRAVRNTQAAITRSRLRRTATRELFRICGAIPPLGRAVFAA